MKRYLNEYSKHRRDQCRAALNSQSIDPEKSLHLGRYYELKTRACQHGTGFPKSTLLFLRKELNKRLYRGIGGWDGCQCRAAFEALTSLDGQKSWYGELRIAVAPNGWHAVSTSYWYGQGGGGSSPSVWNRTAYTTRDEAVAAGINNLIAAFEGIRDCKGYAPQNQSALAQRMIETLKAYLAHSRQLSLF